MTRSFIWLDVFTDRPFSGNPLAVFPDAVGLTDTQMAAIARELNLSETTFVFPSDRPEATHRVRIMTPTRELPFAGHPTVGTAVALAELAGLAEARFTFGLNAGPTPVTVLRQANGVRLATFVAPQTPRLSASPIDVHALAALVGLQVDDIDQEIPLHLADAGGTVFLVAVVRSLEALGRCNVHGSVPGIVGVYIACRVKDRWQARMFAPEAGVVEDPATGSAAVSFAATLHSYVDGFAASGTHAVNIRQGVEMGRPSEIALAFDIADGDISEVRLTGSAVVVLGGEINEPATYPGTVGT